MGQMTSPPLPTPAEVLGAFLRDLRTLAAFSKAEAGLGERLEAIDPEQAILHMQTSVAADTELVDLITGPRGQMCMNWLDVMLRRGVVA